jgi:TRAP-type C4-dicarboxylate transport system substrate-binding protein
VFSKDPVIVPDDLRRQKMATSPDSKEMNLAFRTIGFPVVETDMKDLGFKLSSNAINAVYLTPVLIAANMMQKNLPHMLKMPIAPILTAIIMNRVTWNKLDSDQQRQVIAATKRVTDEFDAATPRLENNAIERMVKDGLKVSTPSQTQQEQWQNDIFRVIPSLVGTTFDRNLYERINGILEEARKK